MPSEIAAELRTVVFGRASIIDGVFPPLVFGVISALAGVTPAAIAALAIAIVIVLARLIRGNPLKFALAGLAGTLIATGAALLQGPEGFFLPAVVSGAATAAVIVVSIAARRPFVAWTSWLARNWPIDWYWHPRVRPAYTRASWWWAAFFALRALGQWLTLDSTGWATAFRVVAGWPALIGLLIVTYLAGRRRLVALGGPSVEEYSNGQPEPWVGQQSGF